MSQKLLVPQDILSHFGPFRKCCRFYVVSLEGFDKDGTIGLESAIDVKNTLSYLFKKDGKSGSAQILSCLKVRNFDEFRIFLSVCLERCSDRLCLAAQFVQEGSVGDQTILILLGGELIKHLLAVLLGDHVT